MALRGATQGLDLGSWGVTRVGNPMEAEPACLNGSGACNSTIKIELTQQHMLEIAANQNDR